MVNRIMHTAERPKIRCRILYAIFCFLWLAGCDRLNAPHADTLYLNGRIYTVDENNSWAESLAVRGAEILAVGTENEIRQYRGTDTIVFDLQDRFVMPGIHDMHLHPLEGGIKERFECNFAASLTMSEILQVVSDCAAQLEPGEWLRGGQWPSSLLKSDQPPSRHLLDQVTREHPVFLMDWAVHNAWLNTAALEALGIADDTPDPAGGQILRDAKSGKATGLLLDNAAYEAQAKLPPYSREQHVEAARAAIEQFVGFGITSFKDAIVVASNLEAYHELARAGQLKARVFTSLAWKSSWSASHDEELANILNRQSYASELLKTDFVKIMLDGVPVTRTSAMLEPYLSDETHGDDFRGKMMFQQEELNADVAWLDANGLTIKIHATGDRSARAALDAIQFARKQNGNSGLMHEVSHAQFIHRDDLPRFRELDVAAEMCPILWYPTVSDAARAAVLGEYRAARMWPIKSLLDSGALVFYGSDWPAVVRDPNPWPGIEAMVTRQNPYGELPGTQWGEQAISLADAIRIVTINGAAAGKNSHSTGSIEPGKAADFVVLDRNIFEVPIDEVSDVQVVLTVVNGSAVYQENAKQL